MSFCVQHRTVKRSSTYPSLKVGDCVTLSSRLSLEPSACHIWLQSVGAAACEPILGPKRQARIRCERENDRAVGSYLWGFTLAPTLFEAVILSLCSNREDKCSSGSTPDFVFHARCSLEWLPSPLQQVFSHTLWKIFIFLCEDSSINPFKPLP